MWKFQIIAACGQAKSGGCRGSLPCVGWSADGALRVTPPTPGESGAS